MVHRVTRVLSYGRGSLGDRRAEPTSPLRETSQCLTGTSMWRSPSMVVLVSLVGLGVAGAARPAASVPMPANLSVARAQLSGTSAGEYVLFAGGYVVNPEGDTDSDVSLPQRPPWRHSARPPSLSLPLPPSLPPSLP